MNAERSWVKSPFSCKNAQVNRSSFLFTLPLNPSTVSLACSRIMKGRPSGDSLQRKLSTKGATMSKRKYVAFDVHLATIAFCIVDETGKILW